MASQKFLSLCLCLLVASTAIVEARQSFLSHIFGGGHRHQSRGVEFILAAGLLAKLLSHYRGHHHHGHHHHGHHHHGHALQGNALYQGHSLQEGRAADLGIVLPHQEQLLQQAQAQAMQQLQVIQMAQARAMQQVRAMQYLPQAQVQQFLPQGQMQQQLLTHQAQASQLLPEIQASQLFPEVQASELMPDVQASELLPLASEILPQALEQEFRQALQGLQLQNMQL